MGNTFTRDTNDTIHWNSLKTENLSGGNDNNYSAMSQDSKLLLNRLELNLPKIENNSEEMSDIDNIFSKSKLSNNLKPLVGGSLGLNLGLVSESEVNEPVQNNQEDLSATSPFISSEMYNLLMNNQTQTGGAIVRKSIQKGGKIEGDDSSTSSTSSSNMDSDDSSSSDESEKKKKTKSKGKKNLKGGKKVISESSNSNELSYISSSAHTGKAESSSESSSASESVSESVEKSELTGGYESSSDSYVTSVKSNEVSTIKNLNNNLPNSSINTSDINMITE